MFKECTYEITINKHIIQDKKDNIQKGSIEPEDQEKAINIID